MIGVLAAMAVAGAWPGDWRPSAAQSRRLAAGDVVVDVRADRRRSAGVIRAAVDIRAEPRLIYAFLTSCAEAPKLVAFVKDCRVITGPGPKGGWDLREADVSPAIVLPRVRAVFRSDFDFPRRIVFRCMPGSELRACNGEWRLDPTRTGAVRVTYIARIVSPYPAPQFVVRTMLRAEIAESLRKLRKLATEP